MKGCYLTGGWRTGLSRCEDRLLLLLIPHLRQVLFLLPREDAGLDMREREEERKTSRKYVEWMLRNNLYSFLSFSLTHTLHHKNLHQLLFFHHLEIFKHCTPNTQPVKRRKKSHTGFSEHWIRFQQESG